MFGAIGAAIGGVLNLVGQKKAAKNNRNMARETNEFNAHQAALSRNHSTAEANRARVFDSRQSHLSFRRNQIEARAGRQWDAGQVALARRENRKDALAAEARSRRYLAADRDYSSPAAERARLEAAGFNPLARADSSSAVPGGGAVVPGAVSPAESAIATSVAASSGIGGSVAATGTFAPESAPDFSFVSDAFAAYGDAQMREQEVALRRSQIEMENARLTKLMQIASQKPVVPGIYESAAQGASLRRATASGPSVSAVPVPAGASAATGGVPLSEVGEYQQPTARDSRGNPTPKRDAYQATVDVYDPNTNSWSVMFNPDLADAGLIESATAAGQLAVTQQAKPFLPAVKAINDTTFSALDAIDWAGRMVQAKPLFDIDPDVVRKYPAPVGGDPLSGAYIPQRQVR